MVICCGYYITNIPEEKQKSPHLFRTSWKHQLQVLWTRISIRVELKKPHPVRSEA